MSERVATTEEPRRQWRVKLDLHADSLTDVEQAFSSILWRLHEAAGKGETTVNVTSGWERWSHRARGLYIEAKDRWDAWKKEGPRWPG